MTTNSKLRYALDIGFGRVKAMQCWNDNLLVMPSIVLPHARQLVMEGSSGRDTRVITVDGETFEVGKEIHLAQSGAQSGRTQQTDWTTSPEYAALVGGSIDYLTPGGQDLDVDLVVLGLPVNPFCRPGVKEALAAAFTNRSLTVGSRKIHIRRASVQAQPFGGFMALDMAKDEVMAATADTSIGFELRSSYADTLSESTILIIDPGYNTIDWSVIINGRPNTAHSDSRDEQGREKILAACAKALSEHFQGRPISPLVREQMDERLRQGRNMSVFGESINLTEMMAPVIAKTIRDPLAQVMDNINSVVALISLIVVVGGHPDPWAIALRDLFPGVPVVILNDSIGANVRGFKLLGEIIE